MTPTLRELWDHAKALYRGERRHASYGQRGRVYERKHDDFPAGNHSARGESRPTVKIVVIRSDGTREEIQ